MNAYQNGLAPDPRPTEQKVTDYQHPAGAIVLNWVEKTPDQWKKYVPREQDGSLSCMAQAGAKALATLGLGIVSAHPPYRSRANFPDGGMWTQDLGEVYRKVGTTLETLDPSQSQNESTMNRDIAVATPDKIGSYFFPNHKSIDEIAEAIEIHKHCVLVIHANHSEWTAIPTYNGSAIDFGHGICGIDYFLHNGVKTILLEDSTGHFNSFDGNGQRLITEDYLLKRCDGAIYFTLPQKYVFTKVLRAGMKGADVQQLQRVLGIKTDGIFGVITLRTLKAFQSAHGLVPDGVVGEKTNAVLNSL